MKLWAGDLQGERQRHEWHCNVKNNSTEFVPILCFEEFSFEQSFITIEKIVLKHELTLHDRDFFFLGT